MTDPRLYVDEVVVRLAGTGRPVGDAQAPTASNFPYMIVWPLDADDVDGTLAAPSSWMTFVVQVSSFGTTPEQSEWMNQKAIGQLDGWTPPLAGVGPLFVETERGTDRDDSLQPPLFQTVTIFSGFAG